MPPFIWSRVWYMVLFGATIGAGLDYLHTHGEEITYPEGTNHWRAIFTFAVVYSLGPLLQLCTMIPVKGVPPPAEYKESVLATVGWCIMYAFTAYGDIDTHAIAIVLTTFGLYYWYHFHNCHFISLISAAIVGIGFGLGEGFLAEVVGTMSYVKQDYLGIPVWLPALYFSSAFTWIELCRRLLTVPSAEPTIFNDLKAALFPKESPEVGETADVASQPTHSPTATTAEDHYIRLDELERVAEIVKVEE